MTPALQTKPLMTKAEVCEHIGKSKRTVAQYIADGKLPAQYVSGPHGREARFKIADVERLKRELEVPMVRAVPAPAQALQRIDPMAEVVAAFKAMRELPPVQQVQHPRFLAIDLAAEYTGLPEGLLTRWIRKGLLHGVQFQGKRYVRRVDLDGLDFPQ